MADIKEIEARKVAEELADEYLGHGEHSFKIPSGGDSNYSFLIDEEIVVKVEKNREWLEKILREPEVLKQLSKNSKVETPELVDSGRLNDLHYRLIEFLKGETLDQYSKGRNFYNLDLNERKKFAEKLGNTLARLHESREFKRCGVLDTNENCLTGSSTKWREGLLEPQEWWHQKLRDEGFEETANRAEKALENKSGLLEKVNNFRLLHMEFDLRNLLFQEDEVAVLDWEVAAVGDPRLDFVMTEKRLIWRKNENEEVKAAFREGYNSIREFKLPTKLEEVYEIFQMTRFLLIFRNDNEMRKRILERLDQLFRSLET